MRRNNIVSQIFLTLTVITFALAAPVLVQEKREACVDGVHVPRDVIAVLRKRALGEDLYMIWDGLWHFENMWGKPAQNLADSEEHELEVFPPPPNQAEEHVQEVHAPQPNLAQVQAPEVDAPPPNLAGAHVPEMHVPPYDPPNSDSASESMVFDDDAPPGSPQSGHSHSSSPPISPEWPTVSEHWYTPPSSPSPESSTESY
jgi:hypothetical protein